MWYIFPQLQGLGFSVTSKWYGIKDSPEAKLFLQHPVLSSLIIANSNALLQLKTNGAHAGIRKSGRLEIAILYDFIRCIATSEPPVFQKVLDKFLMK